MSIFPVPSSLLLGMYVYTDPVVMPDDAFDALDDPEASKLAEGAVDVQMAELGQYRNKRVYMIV